MQMVSIPHDTQIFIPGHGVHKLNAAYAYGGPALAMKTVENFTGIKIELLYPGQHGDFKCTGRCCGRRNRP